MAMPKYDVNGGNCDCVQVGIPTKYPGQRHDAVDVVLFNHTMMFDTRDRESNICGSGDAFRLCQESSQDEIE